MYLIPIFTWYSIVEFSGVPNTWATPYALEVGFLAFQFQADSLPHNLVSAFHSRLAFLPNILFSFVLAVIFANILWSIIKAPCNETVAGSFGGMSNAPTAWGIVATDSTIADSVADADVSFMFTPQWARLPVFHSQHTPYLENTSQ